MKTYNAHIQFDSLGITVKAKNARDAKRKILAKVAKLKPVRLVDRQNLWIYAE